MNFLTKHSKAFYMTYGILIGAFIILGVFYLTQYANVRVLYTTPNGGVEILSTTVDSANRSNQYVFSYFAERASNELQAATGLNQDFDAYAMTVYNFQVMLSNLNDLIITFGVISLICFALLLVLSNHNRRIYYKSNLIGGIILPLVVVALNIVLLVKNLNAMGIFAENDKLFNIVALMQSDNNITLSQLKYSTLEPQFTCNTLSFVLYTVLFIILIVYSLFMSVYAYLKYRATAEERAEIEKKAVVNND